MMVLKIGYSRRGSKKGDSETVVGEWLKERGNRNKVFISTKVGGTPEDSSIY